MFTFNKPLKQSNPRTQVKPLVLTACTHDESLCELIWMFIKHMSAAHRAQVSVQEILSKAGWSSAQTFAIYYDKNLDTLESNASQFQEAILTL